MKPIRLLSWILFLAFGAPALALNVSGNVVDASGNAMVDARIEIYDQDTVFDDLRDVVYTDAAGNYTSGAVQDGDDLYVRATWEFQLGTTPFYNGYEMRLDGSGGGSPWSPVLSFVSRDSAVIDGVSTPQVVNIAMGQTQPVGLSTLVQMFRDFYSYIEANQGTVGLELEHDQAVRLIVNPPNFFSDEDQYIYIRPNAFNGTGTTTNTVSVYHELAHSVHYRHNGDSLPPFNYFGNGHTINSEEEPGAALNEGYASYIAQLVAESVGVASPLYRGYRDDGISSPNPANALWRGDESPPSGHSGRFESGEDVEGAFSGFQFALHGIYSFETNFKGMADHDPQNLFDLVAGLVVDAGGPGTQKTRDIYTELQRHGIVFSRARFAAAPFDEQDPPDAGPPAEGNRKEINGFLFLRGTVTTNFETLAPADLGVDRVLPLERVDVGFLPAIAGTVTPPATFTSFTPSASFASGSLELDTTAFNATRGDGDWELLIRGENRDGFQDNFLPTWLGDGTNALNTDELYLRTIGAWYDEDRDPATNLASEGMVIVDNTPPTVSNFKPH